MKRPNVMVDFHHSSLLYSFIMLFERRLGGQVYRPIGTEWAERGFWKVYDHPFTIAQFLGLNGCTAEPMFQQYPDGTKPLNVIDHIEDGVYYCQDVDSGYCNKAITIDKFLSLPFDYVIASLPQHIEPYTKLCEMHPNHPKLIFQIGNAWPSEAIRAKNIMASANVVFPEGVNAVTYHQEFDTEIFKPDYNYFPGWTISSFVNCFSIEGFYTQDWVLFTKIEREMPQWTFRSYGGQCRDGAAHGSHELAQKMREARFIWHTKAGGDGYGHVLHNSAAVGRPLITKKSYYHGKLGEALMIDGETCINIDNLSISEIMNKIEYFSEPNRYLSMCEAVVTNFAKVVNFDREAEEITAFLERLT